MLQNLPHRKEAQCHIRGIVFQGKGTKHPLLIKNKNFINKKSINVQQGKNGKKFFNRK